MRSGFGKLTLVASLGLALAFTFSCSSNGVTDDDGWFGHGQGYSSSSKGGGGGGGSDGSLSYQGKTYKIVQIGTQIWMAENLKYNAPGSKCGDESTGTYVDANTATCDTYGRMYNWATAMGLDTKYNSDDWGGSDVKHQGICPSGWHIPSDADWTILTDFAGGESIAGTKLKSKTGWNSYGGQSGNGTDIYAFAALPCCRGTPSGNLTDVGEIGTWWTATENGDGGATIRRISYESTDVDKGNPRKKTFLYSIRCLKNGGSSPGLSSSSRGSAIVNSSSSSILRSSSSAVLYSSSSIPRSSSSAVLVPYSSSSIPRSSSSSATTVSGSCNIKDYRLVDIGKQTWMAENLNCNVAGSVCYNNDPANCNKYGRLYDWETAMKACPKGWHLPDNDEWQELVDFVGGEDAGKNLKATSGWSDSGNGTDKYGFTALPGGFGSEGYTYVGGEYGFWWSSSEYSSVFTTYWAIYNFSNDVYNQKTGKDIFYSVRCIKD